MVPKLGGILVVAITSFRAVLFRMVPKPKKDVNELESCFRAVLFRMVPKQGFEPC